MSMKLWVDDVRSAPDESWDVARDYATACVLFRSGDYTCVSLDHDLGDFHNGREYSGYDVLLFIVEELFRTGREVPEIRIHSANPVGYERMLGVVERYIPYAPVAQLDRA